MQEMEKIDSYIAQAAHCQEEEYIVVEYFVIFYDSKSATLGRNTYIPNGSIQFMYV